MSESNPTPSDPSHKPARGRLPKAKDLALPKPPKPTKPDKPYPDFPLTAHPAGYWCKKIRGKIHYFGPWEDPQAALDKYLAEKDNLHAGRTPKTADAGALTVKELCNRFLNAKQARVDTGELSPRTWAEYKNVADRVVKQFGKGRLVDDLGPSDFAALRAAIAKVWGPVRLGNAIQNVRSIFMLAFDDGLIDRPMRFGQEFARPSAKTLRLHRAEQGPKFFAAEEVRGMIDGAGVPFRAMVLLGINCGFGLTDCGRLPLSAVDLDVGVIGYARPKTGVPRRCTLWPETVQALREALARRPEPKEGCEDLVFVTRTGGPWHKGGPGSIAIYYTNQLLRKLGISRRGVGFYSLRHTFRTIADEAKDQPAADCIMGHEVASMSSVYRERISDERLRAVTEYVRGWLFVRPATPQG